MEQPETPPTRHLLIVDDEPVILQILQAVFEGEPYRVTAVGTGREASQVIAEQGCDLLLTDKNLPDVSGIDLFHWLGEHHPRLKRRTVFMTAGAFTPSTRASLAEVRNPVLHKPFDTKTLRWILAQTARQRDLNA